MDDPSSSSSYSSSSVCSPMFCLHSTHAPTGCYAPNTWLIFSLMFHIYVCSAPCHREDLMVGPGAFWGFCWCDSQTVYKCVSLQVLILILTYGLFQPLKDCDAHVSLQPGKCSMMGERLRANAMTFCRLARFD